MLDALCTVGRGQRLGLEAGPGVGKSTLLRQIAAQARVDAVVIANTLARETGTAAPVSGLGQQLWQAAARAAGPGASVSELVRWVERLNDAEVSPGAGPRQGARP